VWQSDCLFYISDNKFHRIDIAFCALLKNVRFLTHFTYLKWIGFYLLQLHNAYSMVGMSLAGFVSAISVAAIRTYISANFIVKHLLYFIWIVTFMQYM